MTIDEEEVEMFTVRLSNASNATLSGGETDPGSATVTIDDNDDPWVTVRYNMTSYRVGESEMVRMIGGQMVTVPVMVTVTVLLFPDTDPERHVG